jgi:hypothetical protein
MTNRTIEGDRSVPRIHMGTLYRQLKDSDRFLMGLLSPPTTPPALQQDQTIDTDFITGECNKDNHPSTTITNLGVGSAQADNRYLSHPACSTGSLTLTEAELLEGLRVETDNTASCITGQELGTGPSK